MSASRQNEIGLRATAIRRKASLASKPKNRTPSANTHEIGAEETSGRLAAIQTAKPKMLTQPANIGQGAISARPGAKKGAQPISCPPPENFEIGDPPPAGSRRTAAIRTTNTTDGPQQSAPTAEAETPKRRTRAKKRTKTICPAPASEPIPPVGGAGDVQSPCDTQRARDIAGICRQLKQLQIQRRICLVASIAANQRIEHVLAHAIGFPPDSTEKQRKDVFAQAKAFRLMVEKSKEGQIVADNPPPDAVLALFTVVRINAAGRKLWDDQRAQVESQMEILAKRLPVWETFGAEARGFGLLGLAKIVGCAAEPIGDYRTVSGLWKRFGLAVINGERQQKRTNAEEAALHGYDPLRRSEMWNVADPLFRAQWVGDRDKDGNDPKKTGKPVAIPAHAIGPYGELYAKRRAYTAAKNEAGDYAVRALEIAARARKAGKTPSAENVAGRLTKSHLMADARRIMSKRLLLDLWVAWRKA